MTYREALAQAQAVNAGLTATDFKPDHAVHLVHEDGSTFLWMSAFIHTIDKQWIAIFTEHFGLHVFDRSDTLVLRYFQAHAW